MSEQISPLGQPEYHPAIKAAKETDITSPQFGEIKDPQIKTELDELREKYREMIRNNVAGYGRIPEGYTEDSYIDEVMIGEAAVGYTVASKAVHGIIEGNSRTREGGFERRGAEDEVSQIVSDDKRIEDTVRVQKALENMESNTPN